MHTAVKASSNKQISDFLQFNGRQSSSAKKKKIRRDWNFLKILLGAKISIFCESFRLVCFNRENSVKKISCGSKKGVKEKKFAKDTLKFKIHTLYRKSRVYIFIFTLDFILHKFECWALIFLCPKTLPRRTYLPFSPLHFFFAIVKTIVPRLKNIFRKISLHDKSRKAVMILQYGVSTVAEQFLSWYYWFFKLVHISVYLGIKWTLTVAAWT